MTFSKWLNESTQNVLTAYHCGSEFENFSTEFSGQGEGNIVLGPGIYFVTKKEIALMYAKYGRTKNKFIYEAEIDTTNFYCFGHAWLRNSEQSAVIGQRVNNIAISLGYKDAYSIKSGTSFNYGTPPIGGIVKLLGKNKALEELKKNNIQGSLEYIQPNVTEMSVFDTSVIKLLNKEKI